MMMVRNEDDDDDHDDDDDDDDDDDPINIFPHNVLASITHNHQPIGIVRNHCCTINQRSCQIHHEARGKKSVMI
jgi:hypothetical protein